MDASPSPAHAAAIAVAIARFEIETASARVADGKMTSPWQRAALAEGIGAKDSLQKHLEGGFEWLS